MPDIDLIDNLKIRASYGQLGNDRIPSYQYLSNYSFGGNAVFGTSTVKTLQPGVIPNFDVTWEVANIANVGMNLGLMEGRFDVEFDYFVLSVP